MTQEMYNILAADQYVDPIAEPGSPELLQAKNPVVDPFITKLQEVEAQTQNLTIPKPEFALTLDTSVESLAATAAQLAGAVAPPPPATETTAPRYTEVEAGYTPLTGYPDDAKAIAAKVKEVTLKTLAQSESGGNYKLDTNPNGYMGKYQVGTGILTLLGYLEPGAPKSKSGELVNSWMKNPKNWTAKAHSLGIYSLTDFLNNERAQDAIMSKYYDHLYKLAQSPKYAAYTNKSGVSREKALGATISAMHMLGAAGLAREGLNGVDGNKTKGLTWYTRNMEAYKAAGIPDEKAYASTPSQAAIGQRVSSREAAETYNLPKNTPVNYAGNKTLANFGADVFKQIKAAVDSRNTGETGQGEGYFIPKGARPEKIDPRFMHNFKLMAAEYKQLTGKDIVVSDGHRTTAEQAKLKREKGNQAATAGNSNHEYGLAFDLAEGFGNELAKMGLLTKYGFHRPLLKSLGETWHIELKGLSRRQAFGTDSKQWMNPSIGETAVSPGLAYAQKVLPGVVRRLSMPSDTYDNYLAAVDARKAHEKFVAEYNASNEGSLNEVLGAVAGVAVGAWGLVRGAYGLATLPAENFINQFLDKKNQIDFTLAATPEIIEKQDAFINKVVGYDDRIDQAKVQTALKSIKSMGVDLTSMDSIKSALADPAKQDVLLGAAKEVADVSLIANTTTSIFGSGGAAALLFRLGKVATVGAKLTNLAEKIGPNAEKAVNSLLTNQARIAKTEIKAIRASETLTAAEKAAKIAEIKKKTTLFEHSKNFVADPMILGYTIDQTHRQAVERQENNNQVEPGVATVLGMAAANFVAGKMDFSALKSAFKATGVGKAVTATGSTKKAIAMAVVSIAGHIGVSITKEGVQELTEAIIEPINTKYGTSGKYKDMSVLDLIQAESANIILATIRGMEGGGAVASIGAATTLAGKGFKGVVNRGTEELQATVETPLAGTVGAPINPVGTPPGMGGDVSAPGVTPTGTVAERIAALHSKVETVKTREAIEEFKALSALAQGDDIKALNEAKIAHQAVVNRKLSEFQAGKDRMDGDDYVDLVKNAEPEALGNHENNLRKAGYTKLADAVAASKQFSQAKAEEVVTNMGEVHAQIMTKGFKTTKNSFLSLKEAYEHISEGAPEVAAVVETQLSGFLTSQRDKRVKLEKLKSTAENTINSVIDKYAESTGLGREAVIKALAYLSGTTIEHADPYAKRGGTEGATYNFAEKSSAVRAEIAAAAMKFMSAVTGKEITTVGGANGAFRGSELEAALKEANVTGNYADTKAGKSGGDFTVDYRDIVANLAQAQGIKSFSNKGINKMLGTIQGEILAVRTLVALAKAHRDSNAELKLALDNLYGQRAGTAEDTENTEQIEKDPYQSTVTYIVEAVATDIPASDIHKEVDNKVAEFGMLGEEAKALHALVDSLVAASENNEEEKTGSTGNPKENFSAQGNKKTENEPFATPESLKKVLKVAITKLVKDPSSMTKDKILAGLKLMREGSATNNVKKTLSERNYNYLIEVVNQVPGIYDSIAEAIEIHISTKGKWEPSTPLLREVKLAINMLSENTSAASIHSYLEHKNTQEKILTDVEMEVLKAVISLISSSKEVAGVKGQAGANKSAFSGSAEKENKSTPVQGVKDKIDEGFSEGKTVEEIIRSVLPIMGIEPKGSTDTTSITSAVKTSSDYSLVSLNQAVILDSYITDMEAKRNKEEKESEEKTAAAEAADKEAAAVYDEIVAAYKAYRNGDRQSLKSAIGVRVREILNSVGSRISDTSSEEDIKNLVEKYKKFIHSGKNILTEDQTKGLNAFIELIVTGVANGKPALEQEAAVLGLYEKTKEEPKVETKEEPKVETKEKPKVETKEKPKVETKEEPKVETKEEPKVETKEEPKVPENRTPVEKVTEELYELNKDPKSTMEGVEALAEELKKTLQTKAEKEIVDTTVRKIKAERRTGTVNYGLIDLTDPDYVGEDTAAISTLINSTFPVEGVRPSELTYTTIIDVIGELESSDLEAAKKYKNPEAFVEAEEEQEELTPDEVAILEERNLVFDLLTLEQIKALIENQGIVDSIDNMVTELEIDITNILTNDVKGHGKEAGAFYDMVQHLKGLIEKGKISTADLKATKKFFGTKVNVLQEEALMNYLKGAIEVSNEITPEKNTSIKSDKDEDSKEPTAEKLRPKTAEERYSETEAEINAAIKAYEDFPEEVGTTPIEKAVRELMRITSTSTESEAVVSAEYDKYLAKEGISEKLALRLAELVEPTMDARNRANREQEQKAYIKVLEEIKTRNENKDSEESILEYVETQKDMLTSEHYRRAKKEVEDLKYSNIDPYSDEEEAAVYDEAADREAADREAAAVYEEIAAAYKAYRNGNKQALKSAIGVRVRAILDNVDRSISDASSEEDRKNLIKKYQEAMRLGKDVPTENQIKGLNAFIELIVTGVANGEPVLEQEAAVLGLYEEAKEKPKAEAKSTSLEDEAKELGLKTPKESTEEAGVKDQAKEGPKVKAEEEPKVSSLIEDDENYTDFIYFAEEEEDGEFVPALDTPLVDDTWETTNEVGKLLVRAKDRELTGTPGERPNTQRRDFSFVDEGSRKNNANDDNRPEATTSGGFASTVDLYSIYNPVYGSRLSAQPVKDFIDKVVPRFIERTMDIVKGYIALDKGVESEKVRTRRDMARVLLIPNLQAGDIDPQVAVALRIAAIEVLDSAMGTLAAVDEDSIEKYYGVNADNLSKKQLGELKAIGIPAKYLAHEIGKRAKELLGLQRHKNKAELTTVDPATKAKVPFTENQYNEANDLIRDLSTKVEAGIRKESEGVKGVGIKEALNEFIKDAFKNSEGDLTPVQRAIQTKLMREVSKELQNNPKNEDKKKIIRGAIAEVTKVINRARTGATASVALDERITRSLGMHGLKIAADDTIAGGKGLISLTEHTFGEIAEIIGGPKNKQEGAEGNQAKVYTVVFNTSEMYRGRKMIAPILAAIAPERRKATHRWEKRTDLDTLTIKIRRNDVTKAPKALVDKVKEYMGYTWRLKTGEFFDKMYTMGANKLKALSGWLEDSDINLIPYDYQGAARSVNQSIERDVDTLLEAHAYIANEEEENSKNEIYLDWFISKSFRTMVDSEGLNPQSKKLHRHSMVMDDMVTTVSTKDEKQMIKFKRALAQAFGVSIDKTKPADIIKIADALLKISPEDLFNSLNTLTPSQIAEFTRDGNSIQLEIEALKGVTEDSTGIVEVKIISHLIDGIEAIHRYQSSEKAGNEFKAQLTVETDGVTNGAFLKMLQVFQGSLTTPVGKAPDATDRINPEDPNSPLKPQLTNADYLAKGGLLVEDNADKNMVEIRAKALIEDNYTTQASKVPLSSIEGSLTTALSEGEEETPGSPFNPVTLTNAVGALTRALVKPAFMVFWYGAGKKKIVTEVTDALMESLARKFTIVADKNTKNKDEKILALMKELQINHITAEEWRSISMSALKSRGTFFGVKNPSVEMLLTKTLEASYGEAVWTSLENSFGHIIKLNGAVNNAFSTMFNVWNMEYKKRVAAHEIEHGGINDLEKAGIVQDLLHLFPAINSVFSTDPEEKLPVFKTQVVSGSEHSKLGTAGALVKTAAANSVKGPKVPVKTTSALLHVAKMVKEYVDSGVAGSVIPIHAEDSANIAFIKTRMLQIWDALITGIDQTETAVSEFNQGSFENSMQWNYLEEVDIALATVLNTKEGKAYLKELETKASATITEEATVEQIKEVAAAKAEVKRLHTGITILTKGIAGNKVFKDSLRKTNLSVQHMPYSKESAYTFNGETSLPAREPPTSYLTDKKEVADAVRGLNSRVNPEEKDGRVNRNLDTMGEAKGDKAVNPHKGKPVNSLVNAVKEVMKDLGSISNITCE